LASIGGYLSVKSNAALTSLTGLENLTFIEGGLSIGANNLGNPSLTSLTGLEGLTSIGSLSISSNNALISLTGLDNLTSIGGYFSVISNAALTNLTGLENLTFIEGGLSIGANNLGNPSLTSLTGLEDLTSIGSLSISSNDTLTSLTGLDHLMSIGGILSIWNNELLTNLSGLENVTSIGGNLSIAYNGTLTSLIGLDNIDAATIDGIIIMNNDSLSTCEAQSICNYLASPNGVVEIFSNASGCNNPPEIASTCGITLPCLPFGNYYFSTQAEIDNFPTNYPNCTILEGDVGISGNDITNLNGLDEVSSIGGYLSLAYNDTLTSLTGLDNLISIGGMLYIRNNGALANLSALNNLTSIGGDLFITYSYLKSLTGLDNVTSIGGGLEIGSNYALTNLTGLDNLTSVGGYLNFYANDALTSLTGLSNVTSIAGPINIYNNDALTSLAGLDNIDADSIYSLTIKGNSHLSTCEVESVCDYLAIPGGNINISNNASGCNSQDEVEAVCEAVSVPEVKLADKFLIFPNPSSTQITVELPNTPQRNSFLTIYNINSQQLLKQRITEQKTLVDVSGLSSGLYFAKIADDKSVMVGKVVKK